MDGSAQFVAMSTKKSGGRRSSTSKKDLLSEKDEYEGEFNEKGKREGKGVCRFTTGETFEGQFKDGKMHGKGRLALADGDVFEGTWKSGHKQGSGVRRKTDRTASVPALSSLPCNIILSFPPPPCRRFGTRAGART